MNLYKTELVRRVANETRLSQRVVAEVLDTAHATIKLSLRQGSRVVFPGFGTFYTRERGERSVRHIRTGEPMTVPAGRQAAFRAGEHLKHAVSLAPRPRGRRRPSDGDTEDAA
jgi:nucleoid DNA-binding protein